MENFLKLQLALWGAFQKHLQSVHFCKITISDHPLLIEQVEFVKTSVTDQILWCDTNIQKLDLKGYRMRYATSLSNSYNNEHVEQWNTLD